MTDFYFVEEPLVKYRRVHTQNSAINEENELRFFNEYMNIRYHFFDNFPDDLFIQTFKDYFIYENARTHEELLCEQAFLLMKCIGYSEVNPVLGMMKLEELFKDINLVNILQENYNFTPKKYYEYNAKRQFYSLTDAKKISELQEKLDGNAEQIKLLLEIKENQQKYIDDLQNSVSWKITKPLRKMKKLLIPK